MPHPPRSARDRLAAPITAALVALGTFAVLTLVALESREVVVLRTRTPDGHERATRAWIADADGAAWIEAANPERPFLHDLARTPELVLDRAGRPRRCRASVAPNPEGHARVRDLLAAKYGWADCWIALVADTRRSLAVRLDCGAPGAEARTPGAATRTAGHETRAG